jgi:type IV secretory pathway VirB10-like protein
MSVAEVGHCFDATPRETTSMNTIRNLGCVAIILAAFVGCNSEEPTGENPPPPPPSSPNLAPMKPADAKPEAEKKEDTPKEEMKKEEPAAKPEAPKEEPPKKEEEKKGEASAAKEPLSSDEIAEIDKLPAADRAMAMAQLVCPVSGEHLGSMGVPLKVSAEGKTFLLCCKGCDKEVKANPKEVVAKLNQK